MTKQCERRSQLIGQPKHLVHVVIMVEGRGQSWNVISRADRVVKERMNEL